MSEREWTPREKAIQKAAKMLMRRWGTSDMPRAVREEVWLEARSDARVIFDMADAVGRPGKES